MRVTTRGCGVVFLRYLSLVGSFPVAAVWKRQAISGAKREEEVPNETNNFGPSNVQPIYKRSTGHWTVKVSSVKKSKKCHSWLNYFTAHTLGLILFMAVYGILRVRKNLDLGHGRFSKVDTNDMVILSMVVATPVVAVITMLCQLFRADAVTRLFRDIVSLDVSPQGRGRRQGPACLICVAAVVFYVAMPFQMLGSGINGNQNSANASLGNTVAEVVLWLVTAPGITAPAFLYCFILTVLASMFDHVALQTERLVKRSIRYKTHTAGFMGHAAKDRKRTSNKEDIPFKSRYMTGYTGLTIENKDGKRTSNKEDIHFKSKYMTGYTGLTIEDKEGTPNNKDIPFETTICAEQSALCDAYQKLLGLTDAANTAFSPMILFTFMYYGFELCLFLYDLVTTVLFREKSTEFRSVPMQVIYCLVFSGMLSVLNEAGHYLQLQGSKFPEHMHKLMMETNKINWTRGGATPIVLQSRQHPTGHASHFFTFNRQTTAAVSSAIFTYIIILVQFRNSEEDHGLQP